MKDIKNNLSSLAATETYTNEVFDEIIRLYGDMNPEQIGRILVYILLINYAAFGATILVLAILEKLKDSGAQVVNGAVNVDGEPLSGELERGLDNLNGTVSAATDFIDRTAELIEGQGGNIAPQDLSRINHAQDILDGIRSNLDQIGVLTEGVSSRGLGDFQTIVADFMDSYEAFMSIFNAL